MIGAGLVIGALGTLGGMVQKGIAANRQKKAAKKINPVNPVYEATKESARELSLAEQMHNADIAGGAAMERTVAATQANTVGTATRAGVGSNQVLATVAKSQSASNKAMTELTIRRAQNKLATAGLVTGALRSRGRQKEMEHQDKIRRFEEDQRAKDMLEGSARENLAGAFNDLAGFGITSAMIGNETGAGKKGVGLLKGMKRGRVGRSAAKQLSGMDFLPG